jgi:hypothetical protein
MNKGELANKPSSHCVRSPKSQKTRPKHLDGFCHEIDQEAGKEKPKSPSFPLHHAHGTHRIASREDRVENEDEAHVIHPETFPRRHLTHEFRSQGAHRIHHPTKEEDQNSVIQNTQDPQDDENHGGVVDERVGLAHNPP